LLPEINLRDRMCNFTWF